MSLTYNEKGIAYFSGQLITKTLTIANGATLSDGVDMQGSQLAGIIMPAALTGTTLYLQLSMELAGTYLRLMNHQGTDESITFAASKHCGIAYGGAASGRYLKLESDSAEGAERTFTVILRAY